MSSAIPDDISPDELRKEAVRRDLRDRAKRNAERREARNEVADAILAISGTVVRRSGAEAALTAALNMLARDDARDYETEPTNGEVNLAGPSGWWDAVRKQVPRVAVHPLLDDMARGRRNPTWH